MKVTLSSTSKLVTISTLDGASMPARIWEGVTESGIPVHAYITRIAAPIASNLQQFDAELQAHQNPSREVETIPLRMII